MKKRFKLLSILVAVTQCFSSKICRADEVSDDLPNENVNQSGRMLDRLFFNGQPTALHLAAQQSNLQAVTDLVEDQGINPSIRSRDEWCATPLHCAVDSQALDVVRYLIAHGADINALAGLRRFSPLHIAVQQNNFELVNLLVSNGAETNVRDRDGYTPLMWAVNTNNTQNTINIIDLLLRNGANIQALSNDEENVLLIGFRMEREVFDFLLAHGADANIHDIHGEGLLHFSACRSDCDFIMHLIQDGIIPQEEINRRGENGRTPIFYSVWEESDLNFEMLQTLIRLGADTNVIDDDGNTLLHQAICANQDENDLASDENYINLLVRDCGIDVNSQNTDGQTPLMLAASQGNTAAIRLLIGLGADTTLTDNQEQNVLDYINERDNFDDIFALLIELGTITSN